MHCLVRNIKTYMHCIVSKKKEIVNDLFSKVSSTKCGKGFEGQLCLKLC